MDTSSDDKASENAQPKLIKTEPNIDDPDSPYGLDHMFNPNEFPMEDKHETKTLSSPQNHSRSHIDIIWDPSPPASEFGANDPYDSDTQVFTFDISLFNTDDGMPLVHPNLIDWDQQGPPIFDQFKNDEAIVEFFELHEDIPQGDHK